MVPLLVQVLSQLSCLSTPSLSHYNHDAVVTNHGSQFVSHAIDRQKLSLLLDALLPCKLAHRCRLLEESIRILTVCFVIDFVALIDILVLGLSCTFSCSRPSIQGFFRGSLVMIHYIAHLRS